MKQTVEEAAMNFANYESNILDKLPFKVKNVVDYDNGLTRGFKAGAEWQAKQSPWTSVKNKLPTDYKEKLIRLKDGTVRIAVYDSSDDDFNTLYFWNDNASSEIYDTEDVTHWREIPSFDEILEANKDVLERIKEKGD